MDAITLALIKALGGGGGGSGLPPTGPASAGDVLSLDSNKDPQWATPSGGGGVLVVNVTTSGNTMTLDKTWQEIHDSSVPVFGIVRADVGDVGWAFCADIFEDEGDFVVTCVFGTQSRDFTAASANGYPSSTIE